MAKKKINKEPPLPDNVKITDIGEIYETNSLELKRFIRRNVSNDEESEDILHNVFYQLARIDITENPIEQISAWLYRVAKNQIIDRYRKKKEQCMPVLRKNRDDEDSPRDISELLFDESTDPEKKLLRSLVWEELEAALCEMPEEQRVVFELNEMQGIPFHEISESTGIPVNTLLSRKRYAVQYLRKRLRDLYSDFADS
ncbi:MAG: sigma-70 family RNA polymerase sigma factor [Rikenellaceae bacterium]|nr:sigma-70 family RNA polymerase sigma factor [Rikenellaceae bacterium]